MTHSTMARRGNKKQVATYLPESLKQSLESLAASEGRSLSNYLEKLLIEHLGDSLDESKLEELKSDSALLATILEDKADE